MRRHDVMPSCLSVNFATENYWRQSKEQVSFRGVFLPVSTIQSSVFQTNWHLAHIASMKLSFTCHKVIR